MCFFFNFLFIGFYLCIKMLQPGGAKIKIRVYDKDSNKDDLVDYYSTVFNGTSSSEILQIVLSHKTK